MARQPTTASRGGAGDRMRHRRLPPLWRVAPTRLLREPLGLVLMVGVLALVGAAAAAGPLYGEAVADSSLRLAMAAVPAGSPARAAPVVRVNGGIAPDTAQQAALTDALAEVPGLGPTRVTLQSVSTELHPRTFFDPVGPLLTGGRADAPVRLFGVDDPAARLVVVSSAEDGADGLWLPQPVAEATGAGPGDTLRLTLTGTPEAKVTRIRVAGVYAVEDDGRTPRTPPSPRGERLWRDLAAEGYPSDALSPTLRAHLAVADLATAAAVADRVDDDVLWSALAPLASEHPRLADLDATATAVAQLRRGLAGDVEEGPLPAALRPGVASGVVDLAEHAHELADAGRRGASTTTRVGLALALSLVVAAAGWASVRRRAEARLLVATGRRPAAVGLLHVVELLPAAALGGVLGWYLARGLVAMSVGSGPPSRDTVVESVLWCSGGVLAALLAAGAVAAAATRAEARRLEGRPDLRAPWLLVLVVLAVTASVALWSRPPAAGDPLGPLDVLVPPLVVAALSGLGARAFFTVLRRAAGQDRPPTRRTVAGWLARRRLRAPDGSREVAVTIAATGVAMLVFALAGLASTERTVTDRAAVRSGAVVVHRVGESWRLDPGVARQADPPEDGTPLPVDAVPAARNPRLPTGQTVVWRARTTVATTEENVNLLVIDPTGFASAASWGSGDGPVAAGRALLPELAAEDAESAATSRRNGVGSTVPALLVGEVGELGLAPGAAVTVDTLDQTVRIAVRHVLTAFPGATGATLVVPADAFFATQGNDDPRLRPPVRSPSNRPLELGADLWATTPQAAATTLAAYGRPADLVGTLAGARALPEYVAAEQARRYQVALGALFGAVGGVAVALAAIRLARRSPAADRMIAWTGAGRRAPARARLVETGVVLALSTTLGVLAIVLLRPVGGLLLEPGDGAAPPAVLVLPRAALLAGVGWLAVAGAAAVIGMRVAASSRSTVEVLRGED